MFEKMKFSGTWRSYQQKVLDNLQRHLSDEKLHIVAAPGAGKTILGLEVIRRIGKPCLILAPTITIKNQWELRLKQAFLTDPDVADELVSTDILSPKVITISTYQGLLAGLCGCKEDAKKDLKDDTTDDIKDDVSELCDDEEEKTDNSRTLSRINVKKANNLINELKSKKIDLLCFDEAHHLRKEWWKALDFIMKNLKPATTLSLTATPPFDVDLNEWNRYEELCGPVDESISIPELVKNGDLCPHQDLVYFSPLRAEEEKSYEIYQQNAEAFYMCFLSDKNFANEAVKLQIWENPRKHLGLIYDDPSFFIAFASYLIYHNLSISKVFYDLFDTKMEKIPEFNLAFAENLLNKLMFEYREYFPSLNYYIDEFYLQAQKGHLIFNRTLYLSGNPKLTKEMARSLGKLDAIENIVVSECSQLKEKLRLVILADYIKADAFSSQVESLGVIPIFIRLANMGLKGFSLAVLTGKIILIPKEAKEQLIKLITDAGMQSKDIGFKVSKYFPDYLELKPKESVKSKVVHWVTKLFNDGNINILVGTQSLLGEGWDAPAVNSLILSSTVASYMLSNQMRGRAIRTEKGNPDKVSHIWHLVSARTYNLSDELSALMSGYILQKDEADFEKVRKRFDGYEAPSLNSPYDIQNGIERCLSDKLINFYKKLSNKNYLNELTQKMLSYQRIETKEAWKEGLCKGFGMGVGRLKIGLESQKIRFKTFSYIDGYMAKLTSAGAVAYAFLHASGGNKYNNWNPFLMWWVVLGFVTYMLPSTIRVLRTGKPEGILKQISMVILETLFEANIISTNPKMSSLEVNKIADGYYVSAGALSQRDNNIFIQSLQEFLDPIENPRYLLIRKNPILYFLKQVDYYAIPSVIGLNKKNVLLFKEIWKRRIGYCNIIYTRTEIGRDVLLKARVRAYSNLQNKTKKLNRWE